MFKFKKQAMVIAMIIIVIIIFPFPGSLLDISNFVGEKTVNNIWGLIMLATIVYTVYKFTNGIIRNKEKCQNRRALLIIALLICPLSLLIALPLYTNIYLLSGMESAFIMMAVFTTVLIIKLKVVERFNKPKYIYRSIYCIYILLIIYVIYLLSLTYK